MRWHQVSGEVVIEVLRTSRRGFGAEAAGGRAKMVPAHEELLENPAVPRQAIHLPLAGFNERPG